MDSLVDSQLSALNALPLNTMQPGPRDNNFSLWSADGYAYWHLRRDHWQWKNEPDLCVIIQREGVDGCLTPLSACRLFKRKARCRGIRLPCIGIGGVFTPEAFRGRGYASRMLTMLMDEMRRTRTAPLAALYAQDRTLYERLGFIRVRSAGKFGHLYLAPIDPDIEVLRGDWSILPGDHF